MALIARLTRSGMLDVLGQDYVRTARAKGVAESAVVWRHALRNTLIPLVTVVGLQIGELLGGTVVIETVFAWPGVGRLVVQAVFQRDYPLVQAAVFVLAMVFVGVNLLLDVAYRFLDPRIRYA
jgi:ABC-type dipeptide/oligopeptide/nickel transport system permease component